MDPLIENLKNTKKSHIRGSASNVGSRTSKKGFHPLTKLMIVVGIITGLAVIFFVFNTFGGTTINLTLTSNPDLERGLVGHWTFDGGDLIDNVTDSSGLGNDGTLEEFVSTTTVIGKIGQGLEFDGDNDYVQINTTPPSDYPLTLSAWIKLTDVAGDNAVVSFALTSAGNQWQAIRVTGGNVQASSRSGSGIHFAASAISDNVWYLVTAVFESATSRKIYVDGEFKAENTTSNTPVLNTLAIGRFPDATPNAWTEGIIDDVRIYDRALTPDEISRLYGMGATTHINVTMSNGSLSDGLVGHWTFDGGDLINNVTDRGSGGNDGTLEGFTSTTTAIGVIGQALKFDGVGDYVDVPIILTTIAPSDSTICIWIKPSRAWNSSSGDWMIHSDGAGTYFQMGHHTDNKLYLGFQGGRVFLNASATNWVQGEWQQYCTVRGSSILTAYRNATVLGTPIASINNTDDPLRFGRQGSSEVYFDGSIDDVRIYDRALSTDEISRLYNLGATTRINTSFSSGSLAEGLVGHWTFDGGDLINNVTDRGSGGNDGILVGTFASATSTAIGKIGQALSFNGSNDYVDTGLLTTAEAQLSFFAWVKAPSQAADQYLIDNSLSTTDGFAFRTDGTGWDIFVRTDGGLARVQNTLSALDNTWHHVGFVYDGNILSVYEDGAFVDSNSGGSGLILSSSVNLTIGAEYDGTNLLEGIIDDVRLYYRALTQDEISRLYNMGR